MIADLKPYPAMKDSGVPWLGEVPEHWEVAPLRHLVAVKSGEAPPADKDLLGRYPVFGANGIIGHCSRFNSREPRVVVGRVGAAGAVNVTPREAWITDNVLIIDPLSWSLIPAFLSRLLGAVDLASLTSQSAQPLITGGHIKARKATFPPLPEQAAIVRFLDHADRRIRRYIRAKQKLIKLLEEQKQAIIHRAVTRGLDPNVRLKPSGVAWLGDVPVHWEVSKVKTLCRMRSGDAITAMSIEAAGEYPVYGGNGVRGYTSKYTHDGDFALIGRQGALCGNVHIARGRFWASEHAVVASLRPSQVLDWFSAILVAMNLNQYSIAAAQPGLAVERVLNLWLPVPPQEEQSRIAKHIALGTADLTKAVDRAQREISLLREYRTRLIADVVTGKLDVREAAARLPDEADESELLDETDAMTHAEEAASGELDVADEEVEA